MNQIQSRKCHELQAFLAALWSHLSDGLFLKLKGLTIMVSLTTTPFLQYDAKLCGLLDEYDRAFVVHADNVGSKQFMDIRRVSKIKIILNSWQIPIQLVAAAVFCYLVFLYCLTLLISENLNCTCFLSRGVEHCRFLFLPNIVRCMCC